MRLAAGYYWHHYPRRGPWARVRPLWVWAVCAAGGHKRGKSEFNMAPGCEPELRRFECLCGQVTVHG